MRAAQQLLPKASERFPANFKPETPANTGQSVPKVCPRPPNSSIEQAFVLALGNEHLLHKHDGLKPAGHARIGS